VRGKESQDEPSQAIPTMAGKPTNPGLGSLQLVYLRDTPNSGLRGLALTLATILHIDSSVF
jgi:hypothetical protein